MTGSNSEAHVVCQVLGHVDLLTGISWCDQMQRQTRAVLGLLVNARGNRLTVSRIAELIWGEKAPSSANDVVYKHIRKLRGMLGPGADAVLKSARSAGYWLDPARCSIDAVNFRDLVSTGRFHYARGEFHLSASVLEEAIGLWRGDEAFADVREVLWLQEAAVALETERAWAEELRADCYLRAGRTHDALALLAALQVRHPTREGVWALSMTAHAAAGMSAEATEAFARFRVHLRDTAGLDPSPRLGRIHAAILDNVSPVELLMVMADVHCVTP
ncbi:BTAD domain-containing putative transcriptional regulator [Nonomuraea sp. NPDC049714]|uniref:AfsR/SARP family transcriptional regulator n=1 Tax=Nonomuraea sp. NPDC049714 TaxID=3364357 RepID=UPI0037BD53EE